MRKWVQDATITAMRTHKTLVKKILKGTANLALSKQVDAYQTLQEEVVHRVRKKPVVVVNA